MAIPYPVTSHQQATAPGGTTKATGLSSFWNDCPLLEMMLDPGVGYYQFDDFLDLGISGTITSDALHNERAHILYHSFGDATPGTVVTTTNTCGGELVLTNATNNDNVGIRTLHQPYRLSSGSGALWFEARVKPSTITTLEMGILVGLIDAQTMTATMPITAAGALADVNFVGFHQLEADTTGIDCVTMLNGGTVNTVNDAVGTLAVDTYINLGFHMDDSGKITWYIDGAAQPTTDQADDNAATTTPSDIGLGFIACINNGAGTSETLTIDWWKCAQLRHGDTRIVTTQQ